MSENPPPVIRDWKEIHNDATRFDNLSNRWLAAKSVAVREALQSELSPVLHNLAFAAQERGEPDDALWDFEESWDEDHARAARKLVKRLNVLALREGEREQLVMRLPADEQQAVEQGKDMLSSILPRRRKPATPVSPAGQTATITNHEVKTTPNDNPAWPAETERIALKLKRYTLGDIWKEFPEITDRKQRDRIKHNLSYRAKKVPGESGLFKQMGKRSIKTFCAQIVGDVLANERGLPM